MDGSKDPDQTVLQAQNAKLGDYPLLSLRFVQPSWGVDCMSDSQQKAFLEKWQKRSQMTWKELSQHQRHGLGSEKLPKSAIKPLIPQQFQDLDRFVVFRHEGNLPFVGWKNGSVFHVIWIECTYCDVYNH